MNQSTSQSQSESQSSQEYEKVSLRNKFIRKPYKYLIQSKLLTSFEEDRIKDIKQKHLKLVSPKYRQQSDLIPTYRQIHQSLQLLKEKIPHRDIDYIICMLFKNLVEKDKRQVKEAGDEQQLTDFIDKTTNFKQNILDNYQANMRAIENKSGITQKKYFMRKILKQKKFITQEDQFRYHEKRMVAKAFCNRDYGVVALQEELSQSKNKIPINKNRYNTIACGMATESYRRLQRFLSQQCQRSIKPLNRDEVRSILAIMLNCRKNYEAEQCVTFCKFIKIVYGISSVSITEQAAVKLYIAIQKSLKARIGQMQLDRVYEKVKKKQQQKETKNYDKKIIELNKIWSNEMQLYFLQTYKQTKHLVKLRDCFRKKFEQHQHLFTVNSLRSRLNKILRVAFRKMVCFYHNFPYSVVPLTKLNDLKVKVLLRSPDALKVRLLLIDMYFYDQCDLDRLNQTIISVNEFIFNRDNQRMSQVIQAEPPIASAADKVHHNVNISKIKLKEGTKKYQNNQIYLKGKQKNFHHIVSVENGQNLHYYRRVDPNPFKNAIRVESLDEVVKIEQPLIKTKQIGSSEMQNNSIYSDSKSLSRTSMSVKTLRNFTSYHQQVSDKKSEIQEKIKFQMIKLMKKVGG